MRKFFIEIFIWILVIISIIFIVNLLNKEDKTEYNNKIIIGYDDTFVPMGFKDDSGKVVGFDIDLAKAVGEKINKQIIFQPIDWTTKETELRNKDIDLIWSGYSITKEREKQVDFSIPYISDKQVIIVRKNSNIEDKKDLKDKNVGVQSASSAADAISKDKKFLNSLNRKNYIAYQSNNDALMDLDAKRIDAVVADEVLARYYINARGANKYRVLNENFGEEYFAVGIRKNDENLKEEINKGLKEVIKDGTASAISKKWFGKDIILKGEF